MGEPVQCVAGEAFGAEDFGPVFKRQVDRDDQTLPLVSRSDLASMILTSVGSEGRGNIPLQAVPFREKLSSRELSQSGNCAAATST